MALAPNLRAFAGDRHFAAWHDLLPPQRSTRGKFLHGGISNTRQTDPQTGDDVPEAIQHHQNSQMIE